MTNITMLDDTDLAALAGALTVALAGGFPEENGVPRMEPLPGKGKIEAYRDRNIERAVDAYYDKDMSQETLHKIGRALHDIRVRDVLIREILIHGEGFEDLILEFLRAVADSVHPKDSAPILTLCALVEWLRGENLTMMHAFLLGAENADPDYSLLLLLQAATRAGMPASVWAEDMKALTYADCRYGAE
jgi:hypothetical protein